jgi:hypothetical protein
MEFYIECDSLTFHVWLPALSLEYVSVQMRASLH